MPKTMGPMPSQQSLDMEEFKTMFNNNAKRSKPTETISSRVGKSANKSRERGAKINVLGQLFNKDSQKVGRYGGKQFQEKNDSIRNLGNAGPGQVYFDPFGDVIEEQEGANETLRTDFLDRVEEQKKLAQANDHEKKRFGKDEQDFLVNSLLRNNLKKDFLNPDYTLMSDIDEDRLDMLAGQFAENVNQTKKFEKDFGEGNREVPDEFSLVVAVDPPTDVYVDYNQERTAKTVNALGGKKKTDFLALLDRNVEKTQAYREMVEKGMKDAAAAGMTYDRDKDPNFAILRAQVSMGLEREQGHSFLRFVPKKQSKAVHSYSFGFWPMTVTPGMGAVTMGLVMNPDPEAKKMSVIERHHTVSYANYLRAASKVRGLVGSKRTYSFLGYNCTSFAADVANEAGISIKAEDSGDKIKTYRHKSSWIDSPYSLARYVRSAVPQGGDETAQAAVRKFESFSFREQMDGAAVQAITKAMANRLANRKNVPGMGTEEVVNDVGYAGATIGKKDHMSAKNHKKLVKNKLLFATHGGMKSSPMFDKLYLQYRIADFENEDAFANRIFNDMTFQIQETLVQLDEQDGETFKRLMKDKDAKHDIAEARSEVLRQRREKMLNIFGVPTAGEFIASVASGKRLYAAMTMMARANETGKNHWILEQEPDGNVSKTQIVRDLDQGDGLMTDQDRLQRMREDEAIQADPEKKNERTFTEKVFDKMLFSIHEHGDRLKDKAIELSDLACARLGQTDLKLRPSDKVAFAAYLISENLESWQKVSRAGNNPQIVLTALLQAMLIVKRSINDGELDSEMEKTITDLHTVVKTLGLSYQQ